MTPLATRARAFIHDISAIAAVEMALVSTVILVPLTATIAEAGQAMLTQLRLSRGLHAGLMYAWQLPTNAALTDIQNAATAGFQKTTTTSGYGATSVTPSASFSYYCIDPTAGTHGATAVAAGSSCSAGQVLGKWVTLRLTATVNTIFPYAGTPSWSLSVSGTVRVS